MLLSHLENHIPLFPAPKTPHTNNEANHTLLAKSKHYCRLSNSALLTISSYSLNLPKVLIILGELGLPYQTSFVDGDEVKNEPIASINPNGRAPGATIFPFAYPPTP